jgi:hypothetical protein
MLNTIDAFYFFSRKKYMHRLWSTNRCRLFGLSIGYIEHNRCLLFFSEEKINASVVDNKPMSIYRCSIGLVHTTDAYNVQDFRDFPFNRRANNYFELIQNQCIGCLYAPDAYNIFCYFVFSKKI